MNLIRLLKKAFAAIKDPEWKFSERIFLILTFVSEVAVFIALIGDLITGESIYEIAVIAVTLIFVPVVVLTCLYFGRLEAGIKIVVIGLVFFVLPSLFFFGGGIEGGGVIWIIFAFMYVGLVLQGAWRKVMFCFIAILTSACYLVSYFHPEYVYSHSREIFFVDSFLSLVMVGILCYIMTWSQSRLFIEENERAKKEAERAEELTRSQNRFFSSMSHEIRTPINSILGLNELILRDQEATDDIVRDASGIQGAGKLLLSLINDLLDFSKMEAGSMDIVPVDYRVADMISELVNMIWLRANEKGLGFDVSVDPDVPSVLFGDEVRIKQVLINLLNNAVKYTEKGHIELRVESRDADDETIELWISVSDTGKGVKKEDLPYLFDAFKRVDESSNRHIEGTGLGLSVVKQLVELMDGSVTVNSVYGGGSTFTVMVKQAVSDRTGIGELNIHNQQTVARNVYESSFLAPEVRILIVDDNQMNLEVEKRLLEDTDMVIDTALSGKAALEKAMQVHYDAIFMDHLMPQMDGIECLDLLRNQSEGLNRSTPVIVLTANAGSENRELYRKEGFDGYLVKPVSGEAMEEILIRHIPGDKIILRSVLMGEEEEIHTSEKYAEKLPLMITSSSACDLPDSIVRKLKIPIIPFRITTDTGEFKDGVHLDSDEIIRHLSSGKSAVSSPPDEADYTEFFAEVLKRSHNIIHISLTTSMSKDYSAASEAAKSFDNVYVINSESLSSATGMLVLIAYKLMQQELSVEEIVAELETVKHRLKCSFIINTTEYVAKRGLVSERLNKLAMSLNLHPALTIRDDKAKLGGIWFGRTKRAYRKYISSALPADTIPDPEVVFVTYVDIPRDTLKWIEEEIRKNAYFEHVIFQQASAAVSSNCGSGTFGILYFLKSNKAYNLSSFMDDMYDDATDTSYEPTDEEAENPADQAAGISVPEELYGFGAGMESETGTGSESVPEAEPETGSPWLGKLDFIDTREAIKNSGSEDAFKAVLRIFYESISDKFTELENCYESRDWKNYTIKIHALKSSARLVGALQLGSEAELLEKAGKADDVDYILENHGRVMQDYLGFEEKLAAVFEETDEAAKQDESQKPVADKFIMESVYEELKSAAEDMDCDRIALVMKEIGDYSIPEEEREKMDLIRERVSAFDYDGIIDVLGR